MNHPRETEPISLRRAFAPETRLLKLELLTSITPIPASALASKKFLQILASVATVGLVEPVAVIEDREHAGTFRILDGRLRVEALRRLNRDEALCMLATDDESYTYNRHISRLTPVQDARMIARAIEQGVPRERIATVLGINENTVRRKAVMLDGICREAQALLADKSCPGTTFSALKAMRPMRQIEAAELMCGQGNVTSTFARAILAATPPELLEPARKRKTTNDLGEQLAHLERELASLQSQMGLIEETYGINHLHLSVATSYVSTLMANEVIAQWLIEQYPEYSSQFQAIANEAESVSEPRRPVKLPFRRRAPASWVSV